jgi:hypothetical protein
MKKVNIKAETVTVDELSPDPANLRERDDRAKKTMTGSLKRFGPARSIVVDGQNNIRAGNGTVEAFEDAGFKEILIVDPEPGQLVAVRKKEWSDAEAIAYAIADNRTTDLSKFKNGDLVDSLQALQRDGFDLETIGFTEGELDEIIAGLADGSTKQEPPNKGTGLAAIAQVTIEDPKTPVEEGQIFELGPHVLICCDVLRQWDLWLPLLEPGSIFCPYPSPLLPLSEAKERMVMVQPDKYLCSIMVDFFEAAQSVKAVQE